MYKAKFMCYLSLTGGDHSEPFPGMTPKKLRAKKLCTLCDKRFQIIPFSSELAQTFKKVVLTQPEAESLFNWYERLCPAKPKVSDPNSFSGDESLNQLPPPSVYLRDRQPRMAKKEKWTHLYSFNKADRKERMITIAAGLTKRARGLVRCCRKASVRLERLKAEEIVERTRLKPGPFPPPIHLSLECTISLAPVDSLSVCMRPSSQQRVTPSLTISRPGVTNRHLGFAPSQQHPIIGKSKSRAPPGFIPLNTNFRSLYPVPSVRPKVTNQFTLPDLIPVQQTPRSIAGPSHPVVKQMPTLVRSVPSAYQLKRSNCKEVIDLCSSDEEDMNPKHNVIIGATRSKPIFHLPGIFNTHIKKDSSVNRCTVPSYPSSSRTAPAKCHQTLHPPVQFHQSSHPPTPRPAAVNFQQIYNSPLKSSTTLGFTSVTKISSPTLTFKGQQNNSAQPNAIPITNTVPPILAIHPSFPKVTPRRNLGKLSMEKREQMKQSLLKIQQQEGKVLPSNSEKTTSQPTNAIRIEKFKVAVPNTSQLSSSSKDVSEMMVHSCKEPKQKGLTTLRCSRKQSALRKRSRDSNRFGNEDDDFDSELSIITPRRKLPKLDCRLFPQRECEGRQREDGDNDGFSTIIIEVDVGDRDGSPASSLGSPTPDIRSKQKKTELSRLLGDECKELGRKGLDELTYPNQRITRCRTRSLAAVYKS